MRDFEELRIRVRQIGAQRYVVLANGVAQGGRAVRIGADAGALREEFNRLIAIEVGDEPSGPTDTRTGLRKLGRSVYDLIFDDALTESVRTARSRAEENGRGLRLRFDLPPAAQALPIEALCSPADQPEQTLALDGSLSIARSVPGVLPGNRLPSGEEDTDHLRLLVAIATPTGANLPPIDATAELSALGELSEFFVHTDVIHNATRDDIGNWLTANTAHPTAVLLIAHGSYAAERGEGVVILAAKDGTADPIPAQLLSGMLVRAQRLRLVALNLCFGGSSTAQEPFAGLANAIIGKGIPAVVAMPGLVTDRAAGVFGPKLIAGLCANILLDEAVTSARHHIASLPGHTAIEWASPMLFFNIACGHGWLFKAREVREGERIDPLRAGEDAVHQVTSTGGNITPATALVAARFLRLRGDWRRVESTAKTTQPSRERDQLIAEARFEMAWPTVENVCAALTDDDPALARQRLDTVRELVPTAMLRLLTSEIIAAETLSLALERGRAAEADQDWPAVVECYQQIERDQLPGTADVAAPLAYARQEIELAKWYVDLRPQREAGRWETMLDVGYEILAIRPSGYRDTLLQVTYAESRIAEAQSRWAEAVDGYAQCADFLDAPARLAYSLGRLAAEHRHWATAEQHFRDAAELGVGEDYRIGYAAGRAHEDDAEWAAALACYADLPDPAIDIAARKRYAQGRIADRDSDWTGVIDGFGELPDDFADGEVGRLRQFARAKLAEQRSDWRAVLTLLGALPDGGAVGALRWKARGELAEADGDWARAAQCYASAGLEPEHRYAAGRQAELDEDWPTALENFRALPETHRDIAQRITYAAARAAESIPDWPDAVELYTALPNDFADVLTRLPYAKLRAAIEAQQWLDAEAVVEELGDYRDSATLAAYARARSAEEDADWAEALLAYQSCGEHADAPSRATYAKARQLDATGHWSAAKAAYEQADALDPDTKNRIERLDHLLAELPFAEGITETTLVADPAASREPTFPYRALASAGVTPASPTDVVANAPFILMERGSMSWRERVAWDQLRTPAERLLVDARMYRLREPDALAQALATLDPATEPAPLPWLCERLPADTPLLMLLAGDRPGATARWRQRLTDHPDTQDDVHCLALTSFWQAQELEETGAWEQAAQLWRTASACFATLVTDDEFWDGWRKGRASSYRQAVTKADTRLVRTALSRYLIDVLAGHAGRHANAGRTPEADRYQELVFLFESELDAAQCLKDAGGLPVAGGGTLSCGPEYLRLVGLAGEFGQFMAEKRYPKVAEDDASQELLRRLRCAFSGLSRTLSLLDKHRFEAALRALPGYHRMRRSELPQDCVGPTRHNGVGDCAYCREFLEHDPAYTYLPNRRFQLSRDAARLAVRAHLSIARDQLIDHKVEPAMAELTSAIDVADNALIGARAEDAALRMIIGRVDALTEARADDAGPGLDEAIGLVEKAIAALGNSIRPALTTKLAKLLVKRGVWYGSACFEFRIPIDLARAVVDLRRAYTLDPNSTWVRYNLAKGLIYHAGDLPARSSADRLMLFIEAMLSVEGGIELAGMTSRLREAQEDGLEAIEALLLEHRSMDDLHRIIQSFRTDAAAELTGSDKANALDEAAEAARTAGDLTGCAHYLVRAVRADPENDRIRAKLLAVLRELLREPPSEGAGA